MDISEAIFHFRNFPAIKDILLSCTYNVWLFIDHQKEIYWTK